MSYCKFSTTKAAPFIFHDATGALTIDNSCVTAGSFEQGEREFSLMKVCGTSKHVAETQQMYIVHVFGVIREMCDSMSMMHVREYCKQGLFS